MSEVFYYRDGETVRGPLSPSDVKRLISEGSITPSTMVRCGKDGQWIEAKRLASAPPPSLGRSVSPKHRIKLMVIGSVICVSVIGYFLLPPTRHARIQAIRKAIEQEEKEAADRLKLDEPPTAQPVKKLPITGELLDAAISCQAELRAEQLRLWDWAIEGHQRLFRYIPTGNPPENDLFDPLKDWYVDCESKAQRFNAPIEDVVEAMIEYFRRVKKREDDLFLTSAGLPRFDVFHIGLPKSMKNMFPKRQTWGSFSLSVSLVRRESATRFVAKAERMDDWQFAFEGWIPPKNAEKFVVKGVGAFAGEESQDDGHGKMVHFDVIKFLCDEDELKQAVVQARGNEKRFRSQ